MSPEERLAAYVDRLNRGESLDPGEVLAAEPELGPSFLEQLQAFRDLGGHGDANQPVGTLGDYQLRRELGRGGMGVVYEAWQGSMARPVALKVLPAGIAADSKAVSRFVREAQVAGKLQHPNVVSVFGMGVESGSPYYAMELVGGETLAQILKRTPGHEVDAHECFQIAAAFAGAAEGLQHAHAKGVVHRDLKPSNLILDGDGRLRILDFGLARLEGQESLTISGDLIGTPLYMSPEQARARQVAIDHRTDIYSLGATLYEVLARRPPFKGRDHQETLSQIIARDPTPLRRINPRIPRDLETIVLKCLRKEPRDRYSTAEALAQDLQRFVRGDAIEARPQAALEKLARRAARNRGKLAAAAAFLIVVAAAGLLAIANHRQRQREREAAYGPTVTAAVIQMLSGSFHRGLGHYFEMASFDPFAYRSFEADPESVARDPAYDRFRAALRDLSLAAAEVPGRAEAYYYRAQACLLLGRAEEAIRDLERAAARDPGFVPAAALKAVVVERRGDAVRARRELERIQSATGADWTRAWLNVRRALAQGEWEAAAKAYETLMELEAEGQESYLGSYLANLIGRGTARLYAGDLEGLEGAVQDFATAKNTWPGWLYPVLLLGRAYYLQGKHARAAAEFEAIYERARDQDEAAAGITWAYWEACDIEKALDWARKVSVAGLRDRLMSACYAELGRWDEARAAGYRAIAAAPSDAGSRWCVIWPLMHDRRGDWAEAERLCREAIRLAPGSPFGHALLAEAYHKQGRLDAALAAARAALAKKPVDYAALGMMGHVLRDMGRHAEALDCYQKAIETRPGDPDVLFWLGDYHLRTGKIEEAIVSYEQSLKRWPALSVALRGRGEALERLGRLEEAIAAYGDACEGTPADPWSFAYLTAALGRMGRLGEALMAAKSGLRLSPRESKLHESLREVLARDDLAACEKELAEVIAALEEAAASKDATPAVLETLVLALSRPLAGQDYARALEVARLLFERQGPSDASAVACFAAALACSGRSGEAVHVLEDALDAGRPVAALVRQLAELRQALVPHFVSYASIDAALAAEELEDLVPAGAEWRFCRGKSEPAAVAQGDPKWTRLDYDDTGWESGRSGFGFGDGDDATVLEDMRGSYSTLYVRGAFEAPDPARFEGLRLSVLADDGFVAWLNGAEVGRARAGKGGEWIASSALATAYAEEPLEWVVLRIDAKLLWPGENLLALQGLNHTLDSSDLTLLPVLRGRLPRDPERGRKLLEAFRAVATSESGPGLIAYLEARLLQLEGKHQEAAAGFEQLAARDVSPDPRRPEPLLRLAECLRAAGDPGAAEAKLRAGLEEGLAAERRVWEEWSVLSFCDLKRSPEQLQAAFPAPEASELERDGPAADWRWLLERLAAREPLRLRCGGGDYTDASGVVWSRDRFFRGGLRLNELVDGRPRRDPLPYEGDVASTEDATLYRTQRWFPPGEASPAYRLPLPPGPYRVTLHFAEVVHREPEKRVFDIDLEGKTVLEGWEPFRAGFATPSQHTFEVKADDGLLDIGFSRRLDNPIVSALEIRRLD
jgi:tetratricopeptide (TPR) repeat protein